MQTNTTVGLTLFIFGIIFTVFIIFYTLCSIEKYYIDSVKLGKEKTLQNAEIEALMKDNRELKEGIGKLNVEVNKLGQQMNSFLHDYRASKNFLDSLIMQSDKNPEILDSLITYYNDEIVMKTTLIDSVNMQYEEKSNKLLREIRYLETNSDELELALLEKNASRKIFNVKISGLIAYMVFFFGLSLLGIILAYSGYKYLKRA